MKKNMVFLTIVFLAVTLTIPSVGAEQSSPGTDIPTMQKAPKQIMQKPIEVNRPDLVITSIKALGSPGPLSASDCCFPGCNPYIGRQIGVEISIMNKGSVASGRGGSIFSVGVAHFPQCKQDCTPPNTGDSELNIGDPKVNEDYVRACQQFWDRSPTMSFHFCPPITVHTPLAAGETRTIIGKLILPTCLLWSANGINASVYLIVDDMNQVLESNENNNKSLPINITWQ
jgi:hypothetical protein